MGIKVTRIGTGDPLASGLSSTGTVSGTDIDWPTSAGDVVAALDDLTDVNAPAPADGDVLTWDIGASEWVPAAGGGAVATDAIWDAKGDLAVGSGANTAARLAVGSNTYVLTADSTAALGVKWAASSNAGGTITTKDEGTSLSTSVTTLDFVGAGVTASGAGATTTITIPGGGGTPTLPLDSDALDATYGDDFSGASLDAKWTRHTVTSGEETYQIPGLRTTFSNSANDKGYYQIPSSMFTNGRLVAHMRRYDSGGTVNAMLFFVNSSGTGIGGYIDNNGGAYIVTLSAWGYSSVAGAGTSMTSGEPNLGYDFWISFRKAGGNYYLKTSPSGTSWGPESAAAANASTMAYIGFGRCYAAPTTSILYIDRFNVLDIS